MHVAGVAQIATLIDRALSSSSDMAPKVAWRRRVKTSFDPACSVVHDVGSDTHFVRGLCVKPQFAYCVRSDEMVNVDGHAFIKVHKCSKTFGILAGVKLTFNQWMDQLVAIRNTACTESVDKLRHSFGNATAQI